MKKNKVSVIIPTFNEEGVIGNCIKTLIKQVYKDYEIIVVDDCSADKTVEIISSLITDHKSLITLLKQDHKGPGAARNLGAKHAKGEILVFVDADMTFSKTFLKYLVKPILKGKSKGTFSKDEYVENWDNVWSKCWNINEGWQKKKRHPKNYPDKQKVFRAILKKEFVKVDGFDPGGYTDDYSLYEKLGYMADQTKGAIFFHKNPESLKEVYLHAKWVGKRKYKLGYFGFLVAMIRSSFLFSLLIGLIKSLLYLKPQFVVFKVVYDFGIFIGICKMLIRGNLTK